MISDIEAFIDNGKCAWTVRDGRSNYYKVVLNQLFDALGIKDVTVLQGSAHQLEPCVSFLAFNIHSIVLLDLFALPFCCVVVLSVCSAF